MTVEMFVANLSSSLRAKRSNPGAASEDWIASSQELLAMTERPHRTNSESSRSGPQRFARRLGTFSNIRLALNSARFLSSALIFSIKVIASGV